MIKNALYNKSPYTRQPIKGYVAHTMTYINAQISMFGTCALFIPLTESLHVNMAQCKNHFK